jgi:two-component system chemotaxis response regulator CheY
MAERPLILVADDEYFLRLRSRDTLSSAGYRVLTAVDGNDCVAQYKAAGPESVALVILDYIMPGMDGTETFFHLRKLNPAARVLIHSASIEPEKLDSLIAAGALGSIPKPTTQENFLALVEAALGYGPRIGS